MVRRTLVAAGAALATLAVALAPVSASEPSPPGRIAFTHGELTGGALIIRVWTMAADGSDRRPVTAGSTDQEPAWSPDGSRIAYASFHPDRSFDIRVVNADGSGDVGIVTGPHPESSPAWSPDGTRIAYRALLPDTFGTFHGQLVVVAADGSGPAVVITAPHAEADHPDWSPDGKLIAYTSIASGNPEIHVVEPDGSNDRRLTFDRETDWRPEWSPDGTRIAFQSFRVGSQGDVYVMDADGANLTRVTTWERFDGGPSWSPNGRRLVFESDRKGQGQIRLWTARADGSDQRQLTFGDSNDVSPDWQTFGAPVGRPDGPFLVERGGALTVAAPGVLGNDFDGAGDPLAARRPADPARGTLALDPDGGFTYTHGGSAALGDSFTYRADDGTWLSEPAGVTLIATVPGGDPDTVGVVDQRTGIWHLAAEDGTVRSFFFGDPGDTPLVGDWDCDGVDTPGQFRRSTGLVYLRNSNTPGPADVQFFFGNPGDVPLAGDFDRDGCDTVSLYRPSEGRVYVINELGSGRGGLGAADFSYLFGNPGDTPFAGDFDGDGVATVGLYREAAGLVFLRNSNTTGAADLTFFYGDPDDRFVAGDWGGDGTDTVGVFRPSGARFHLRDRNTAGPADVSFPFDGGRGVPVAGSFGL